MQRSSAVNDETSHLALFSTLSYRFRIAFCQLLVASGSFWFLLIAPTSLLPTFGRLSVSFASIAGSFEMLSPGFNSLKQLEAAFM